MLNWLLARVPWPFSGERVVFSQMMPGQVDSHRKKSQCGPLSHIILKKEITQKGSDLNIKARCIQFFEENTGGNFSGLRSQLQPFLRDNTKSSSNRRQIDQTLSNFKNFRVPMNEQRWASGRPSGTKNEVGSKPHIAP